MILQTSKIKHKEFNKNTISCRVFKSLNFAWDEKSVFVYASLSSKKIKELDSLLDLGIKKIYEIFNTTPSVEEKIFDRMKSAIFESGDFLANYLVSQNYPVDDVDYSVGIFIFYKNILYVWIDGDLNALIYRGNNYLLLNDDFEPQFYGSGYVEPKDLILISTNKFFQDNLDYNYLIKTLNFDYPTLIIGYDIDYDFDSSFDQKYDISSHIMENSKYNNNFFNQLKNIPIKYYFSIFYQKLRKTFDDYRFHNKLKDFIRLSKKFLVNIWKYYDKWSSMLLNKIFILLYGKNSLKFQRIKESSFKKNLQLLMLFIILLIAFVGVYYIFNNHNTNSTFIADNNSTDTTNSTSWDNIRVDLTNRISLLQEFVKNQEVEKFENLKTEILERISSLKKLNNVDLNYLNFLENEVIRNEDILYKNYSIQKVDELYTFDNLGNVEIVDFSNVGGVLYALDRLNSRVLVSNRTNQSFEIFVTDTDLKALSQIVCNKKDECYILDEEKGLSILNLKTKKISKFSGLSNAGKGVKELGIFTVGDVEYIYTLKPLENKVMRYMRVGAGISEGEVWNQDLGFGPNTTDIFIDGSIYELSSDGSLRRFYGRKLDSNSFAGIGNIPLDMGGNLQLVATPPRNPAPGVVNRAYISDPKNSRIVVLNRDLNSEKKMTFLGGIKYRGPSPVVKFDSISELILSDDEKYLYCLANNTIFKIIVTDLF